MQIVWALIARVCGEMTMSSMTIATWKRENKMFKRKWIIVNEWVLWFGGWELSCYYQAIGSVSTTT